MAGGGHTRYAPMSQRQPCCGGGLPLGYLALCLLIIPFKFLIVFSNPEIQLLHNLNTTFPANFCYTKTFTHPKSQTFIGTGSWASD